MGLQCAQGNIICIQVSKTNVSQINVKNQDIDFFPDDICRPYYGSVPRWYSQKNDYADKKEGRA